MKIQTLQTSQEFKCKKCQDFKYIWKDYNTLPEKCTCYVEELTEKQMQRMEQTFANTYKECTFENYKVAEAWQNRMYETSKKFVTDDKQALLLLGQSGTGKTHLAVSVAKELMKKGTYVEMMVYPEFILSIKSKMLDGYTELIEKYKTCSILIIDDFLKHTIRNGKVNETDLGIMFDVLDYRYRNHKTVIITSEIFLSEMFEHCETIAGRLKEMATKEYVLEIARDKNRNQRMKGINRI